eukprot:15439451-Alexandrium_andersonii.AAC.1
MDHPSGARSLDQGSHGGRECRARSRSAPVPSTTRGLPKDAPRPSNRRRGRLPPDLRRGPLGAGRGGR